MATLSHSSRDTSDPSGATNDDPTSHSTRATSNFSRSIKGTDPHPRAPGTLPTPPYPLTSTLSPSPLPAAPTRSRISPFPHLLPGHGEGCVEPLLEGAAALEDGWEQEVEEGPELRELVLERGPGEEQPPRGHIVGVEHLRQFAVVVLHPVPLVHNHVLPADLREREAQGWWELGGGDVPRVACDGSAMPEQLKKALRGEYAGTVPPHRERSTPGWESR